MKTLKTKAVYTFFLILFSTIASLEARGQENFAVIANADVPFESINSPKLKRVFNGFVTQWSDGTKAKPSYVTNVDSFWTYLGTTKSNFDRFWTKRVFSGNGVPPIEHTTDEDVVSYVSKISGAIGVIHLDSSESLPSGCKLISLSD